MRDFSIVLQLAVGGGAVLLVVLACVLVQLLEKRRS